MHIEMPSKVVNSEKLSRSYLNLDFILRAGQEEAQLLLSVKPSD